jgi:hypothetical protein
MDERSGVDDPTDVAGVMLDGMTAAADRGCRHVRIERARASR